MAYFVTYRNIDSLFAADFSDPAKPVILGELKITGYSEYLQMMRTDQYWFEKREKVIDHPIIVESVGQRDEIKVGVMGFPEKDAQRFLRKYAGSNL